MKGKRVIYNREIYTVIHDYKNGQLEIQKEKSDYREIQLVKKEDLEFLACNNFK